MRKRRYRWGEVKNKNKTDYLGFAWMINHKLGGYLYATKLGIRTPQILFCGLAKDLPTKVASFGNKYVVKPLRGYAAQGVKVINNGVDVLSGEKVSNVTLVENPDQEIIVEELVESAHPNYEGRVPPDYKFHVFERVPEMLFFVDRNKPQKCSDYFDLSTKDWKYLDIDPLSPHCPPSKDKDGRKHYLGLGRQAALMDAVRVLASKIGEDMYRIDMYDSKDGPVLGEFTPFSAAGEGKPLESCIMSYLFIAHAENVGALTDDVRTIQSIKHISKVKSILKLHSPMRKGQNRQNYGAHNLGFSPEEVNKWNQLNELTKCKKVMKAQHELNRKRVN